MRTKLLLFISIYFLLSCSSDDAEPATLPLEASTVNNVSYGNESDQKFDLYLPANRSEIDTPVIILIHGGGWTSGDKSDMSAFMELLKIELPEIAIVNMNYRLADENTLPHPMQINDITALVAHLNENKSEYQISDNIGFIGTSAGAHLSLLWSYAYDVSKQTKMVCSIVGPTNLKDEAYLNNTDPALQELLNLYGGDPVFLETVSPLFQVSISSPPTILFYGGQDPLIPTTQGADLRDKLEDFGVPHEFTLYENEGHGWTGLNLLDTWAKLRGFIQKNM